jgi:hypothetical protein
MHVHWMFVIPCAAAEGRVDLAAQGIDLSFEFSTQLLVSWG